MAHTSLSLSRFMYHEAARSISTPPGWDASPSQVTFPQFVRFLDNLTVPPPYSWVERGTVRVKCLAKEHDTTFLAIRIGTARTGNEHINHEATVPPTESLEALCQLF